MRARRRILKISSLLACTLGSLIISCRRQGALRVSPKLSRQHFQLNKAESERLSRRYFTIVCISPTASRRYYLHFTALSPTPPGKRAPSPTLAHSPFFLLALAFTRRWKSSQCYSSTARAEFLILPFHLLRVREDCTQNNSRAFLSTLFCRPTSLGIWFYNTLCWEKAREPPSLSVTYGCFAGAARSEKSVYPNTPIWVRAYVKYLQYVATANFYY